MNTRRKFLQGSALLTASALLPSRYCFAQFEKLPATGFNDLVTDQSKTAIRRGLDYLASKQNVEEGWFQLPQQGRNVAVCSLAGLAWLGAGSTAQRGPYRRNISGVVNFLLKNLDDSDFVASPGLLCGRGFATLFLAEVYGMMPRKTAALRDRLTQAVRLIIDLQNDEGGWRSTRPANEVGISDSICQVIALRAAKNAGIQVPHETIERCIAYVKRSQNHDGGFMFPSQGMSSDFSQSAAGMVALYNSGIYEGDVVSKGLNYLMEHLPRKDIASHPRHYFDGHYYAVQAMWHARGSYWTEWYPAIREELLARQQVDGSWDDTFGKVYATSMASIILQMPNSYLPIFQR